VKECHVHTRGDCEGPVQWRTRYVRTTAFGESEVRHLVCDGHLALDLVRANVGTSVKVRRVCPKCGRSDGLTGLSMPVACQSKACLAARNASKGVTST